MKLKIIFTFWCTVDRFRGVKVIFISNAYSVINPYFTYFGINFDEGNIWKMRIL